MASAMNRDRYPVCCVQLDDQTNIRLDNEKLRKIIEKGMESCDIFVKESTTRIR